jgi:hypothetical protein
METIPPVIASCGHQFMQAKQDSQRFCQTGLSSIIWMSFAGHIFAQIPHPLQLLFTLKLLSE